MRERLQAIATREEGQATTEYVLVLAAIVVLVAGATVALTGLGPTLAGMLGGLIP